MMNRVSVAFSDKTNGCGALLYYLIDNERVRRMIPDGEAERRDLMRSCRNPDLSEFVHLLFAERATKKTDKGWNLLGVSDQWWFWMDPGSLVFVASCMRRQGLQFRGVPSATFLGSVVAHELTHTLLDEGESWEQVGGERRPVFDRGEHVLDGDRSDGIRRLGDLRYVMYERLTPQNAESIIFSEITRMHLQFSNKQSVER